MGFENRTRAAPGADRAAINSRAANLLPENDYRAPRFASAPSAKRNR